MARAGPPVEIAGRDQSTSVGHASRVACLAGHIPAIECKHPSTACMILKEASQPLVSR